MARTNLDHKGIIRQYGKQVVNSLICAVSIIRPLNPHCECFGNTERINNLGIMPCSREHNNLLMSQSCSFNRVQCDNLNHAFVALVHDR